MSAEPASITHRGHCSVVLGMGSYIADYPVKVFADLRCSEMVQSLPAHCMY